MTIPCTPGETRPFRFEGLEVFAFRDRSTDQCFYFNVSSAARFGTLFGAPGEIDPLARLEDFCECGASCSGKLQFAGKLIED